MGMFSEISDGINADKIGKKIISSMEETPDEKVYIKKYLLPFYKDFAENAYGCTNNEIAKKVKTLMGD